MRFYILDEHNIPVAAEDALTWAKWLEANDERRVVARTRVGECTVSTVFLGLDHSFGSIAPHLFETMVFPACEIQQRCSFWEEAEAQHSRIVESLKCALLS